jgi:hypothetical protein
MTAYAEGIQFNQYRWNGCEYASRAVLLQAMAEDWLLSFGMTSKQSMLDDYRDGNLDPLAEAAMCLDNWSPPCTLAEMTEAMREGIAGIESDLEEASQ